MTILVADDLAIVRELVATCLQVRGYKVLCATDGVQALKLVQEHNPDLIVCDIAMPGMDGITFLEHLRAEPKTIHTPVILLTGSSDKDLILRAARLGVTDYLLKARFSVSALIDRVKKRLSPAAESPQNAEDKVDVAVSGSPAGLSAKDSPPSGRSTVAPEPKAKRLDRDECIQRIKQAFGGKTTLSGVLTQIMALVSSPAGDIAQLANVITRDGVLTARVIDAANSATTGSGGEVGTTVADAVGQIGFTAVRNLAAAIAIHDAIPPGNIAGFDPTRFWQHSIAVAQLCEQLEMARCPENSGPAYVMGLCHDLGDILLQSHFRTEYQRVREAQLRTGEPLRDLEMRLLGMTRQQLIVTITQSLGLPEAIRTPIEALQNGNNSRDDLGRLCGLLRLADNYANGLLFASGPETTVASFARSECRGIMGVEEPPCPDAEKTRTEVFSLTTMLFSVKGSERNGPLKPIFPRDTRKIWLARDPALSAFDPIHAALCSLGEVQVNPRLPTPAEIDKYQALAVLAWKPTTPGFSAPEILKTLEGGVPLLWAVARTGDGLVIPGPLTPLAWPISLRQIFDSLTQASNAKQAA